MNKNFKGFAVVSLAAILTFGMVLSGCGNAETGGKVATEEPTTNLYIKDFDGDFSFRIFADRPPTPKENYLLDYKEAGFTHYNMTEDDYRLTNADGKFGTNSDNKAGTEDDEVFNEEYAADDGVINPKYSAAIELCEKLGLKVLIRNYYTDQDYFANDDDSVRYFEPPWNTAYRIPIRNITTELTDMAAVDGYYMGDEPSYAKIDDLARLVDWYNQNGGNTFFHLNLLQSYGSFLFNGHTYREYIDRYCEVILNKIKGPKSLGTDYYPLEKTVTGKAYIKEGFLFDYITIADKVKELNSALKDENDKTLTNFCIQAYKAKDKRTLSSLADITFQTNVAMAFGAKSLQYYMYRATSKDNGIVEQASQGKTDLWYWVKDANAFAQKLAPVVLTFDYNGAKVYSGSQMADETTKKAFENIKDMQAEKFEFISEVNARLDTVITEMKDKDGNFGYYAVNYSEPSLNQTDYVNVTFSKKVNKAIVYINGERTVAEVKDGVMQIVLGAGQGAFVYPVYEKEA